MKHDFASGRHGGSSYVRMSNGKASEQASFGGSPRSHSVYETTSEKAGLTAGKDRQYFASVWQKCNATPVLRNWESIPAFKLTAQSGRKSKDYLPVKCCPKLETVKTKSNRYGAIPVRSQFNLAVSALTDSRACLGSFQRQSVGEAQESDGMEARQRHAVNSHELVVAPSCGGQFNFPVGSMSKHVELPSSGGLVSANKELRGKESGKCAVEGNGADSMAASYALTCAKSTTSGEETAASVTRGPTGKTLQPRIGRGLGVNGERSARFAATLQPSSCFPLVAVGSERMTSGCNYFLSAKSDVIRKLGEVKPGVLAHSKGLPPTGWAKPCPKKVSNPSALTTLATVTEGGVAGIVVQLRVHRGDSRSLRHMAMNPLPSDLSRSSIFCNYFLSAWRNKTQRLGLGRTDVWRNARAHRGAVNNRLPVQSEILCRAHPFQNSI